MKILIWIYQRLWHRWLWNVFYRKPDKVISIKGWKTMLVDNPSCRKRITILFPWEKS